MNKTTTIQFDEVGERIYLRIYLLINKADAGWPSFGAVFGLIGGLLSVPLAMVFSGIGRYVAPLEIGLTLNMLSNILFALTLPMLALGACCLDRLENNFPPYRLGKYHTVSLERWHHLRPRHPQNN